MNSSFLAFIRYRISETFGFWFSDAYLICSEMIYTQNVKRTKMVYFILYTLSIYAMIDLCYILLTKKERIC